MKNIKLIGFSALFGAALLSGCSRSGGEFQGREYMPDMAHSVAYEANVYGYFPNNRWGTEEEYRQAATPRTPVEGTVSHKAVNWDYRNEKYAKIYPVYHYENSEAGRTEAQAEILSNPLVAKDAADLGKMLAKGQFLYETYCAVCHGKGGDGNGVLWNSGTGPYKAAPANYLSDDFINSTDGRYYHAIMYGKNKMLSHADKLSFEERWMVIHYIRSLQAKKQGNEYNLAVANRMNQAPKAEEAKEEAKDAKGKEAKTH